MSQKMMRIVQKYFFKGIRTIKRIIRDLRNYAKRLWNNYIFGKPQKTNLLTAYKLAKKISEYPNGCTIIYKPHVNYFLPDAKRKQYWHNQGYEEKALSNKFITAREGNYFVEKMDWLVSDSRKIIYPLGQDNITTDKNSLPDIFIFSVIDWHFRMQRPQHMAKVLAERGHRVFYISNNLIKYKKPFFQSEQIMPDLPLYIIKLAVANVSSIYETVLSLPQQRQLADSLGKFYSQAECRQLISIVQQPFWAEIAFAMPNNWVIYDCMDHHAGFSNISGENLQKEKNLSKKADLVIASSQKLYDDVLVDNPQAALIRNATDYQHFAVRPEKIYQDKKSRKIIGYYGAIADWFDVELIEALAEKFSNCLIFLIGDDTAGVKKRLSQFKNINFTGEVNYEKLPYYLYAFDVCLIPFILNSLTEATNPVKVYEYLSAGKPVVAVDLPELRPLQKDNLVSLAKSHHEFLDYVNDALESKPTPQIIAHRQQFASRQTWLTRVDEFEKSLKKIKEPLVSIIVLTYNNLALTKACLNSIEKYTDYPNYEVIIVDNASTDETPAYLEKTYTNRPNYRLMLNKNNLGFSAGNNVGLKAARGEYLVLLNNDTRVTPGWLRTMVNHFRRQPDIGLLGPITNNIGNEAKVPTNYSHPDEMFPEVQNIVANNIGKILVLKTVAFFCVMLSREILEKVGFLDEAFGVGFFEDDDYCRRVENLGYKIYCAEDVFIHHHLSASFDKLKAETRQALFEKNKKIYEAKWGPWEPHRYR